MASIVSGDDVGRENGEDCYIINKMYVGDYLSLGSNIGHEVINFFRTDNGEHFLYLAPHGYIGKKYANKRIKVVFLTQQCEIGMQEIIGVAYVAESILKYGDDIKKRLKDYRVKHEIKYGGYELKNVFKMNRFYDNKDPRAISEVSEKLVKDDNSDKVTFRVGDYYAPEEGKHVILYDARAKEDKIKELGKDEKNILFDLVDRGVESDTMFEFGGNASQLRYFCSDGVGNEKKVYECLRGIAELARKGRYFEKKTLPRILDKKIVKERKEYRKKSISYLEVMSQINRETIFSNLFRFFLDENRELLKKFCWKLLGKINIDANRAKIKREHHHTDIWIEDDANIIVIENKIHAGLSDRGQLKRYYDEAYKVKIKCRKYGKDKAIHLFMIAPDYYRFPSDRLEIVGVDNTKHKYKMIRYSKIFEVLNDDKFNITKAMRGSVEYKERIRLYYDDFKRAVEFHSSWANLEKQDAMKRRFYNILDQLDEG